MYVTPISIVWSIGDYGNIVKFRLLSSQWGFLALLKKAKIEIAEKKVENEVGQLQKYFQKKLTYFGSTLEKKSRLCDKNSLRYLNLLLGVFFVRSR